MATCGRTISSPAQAEVAAFAARGLGRRQGRGGAAGRRRRRPRPRRRAAAAPFATDRRRSRSATSGCATPGRSWSRGRRPRGASASASTAGAANMTCPATTRSAGGSARAPASHVRRADWILEGGAIDVDGTGLAVTTEQCLLNPNRNPCLSRGRGRGAAARRISASSGVLWLGSGLMNDHTDGHVDNLARFVGAGPARDSRARRRDDPNEAVYRDAADARAPLRAGGGAAALARPGPARRGDHPGLLHELLHRQCGGGRAAIWRGQ